MTIGKSALIRSSGGKPDFDPCAGRILRDSLTVPAIGNQMKGFGLALLVFGLLGSPELWAGMIQTTKGVRLSILHHDPHEGAQRGDDPVVAEKGSDEKTKPPLLAGTGSPKGRVKVRSIANSRMKKRDRSTTGPGSVAARK